VAIKKATGKRSQAAKISVPKQSLGQTPQPVDAAQARENVANLVSASATEIATATGAFTVAKAGQLASVKYLFEVAGLYPATEEAAAMLPENSLVHTLLRRMGQPTESATCTGDQAATPAGNEKERPRQTGEDSGDRQAGGATSTEIDDRAGTQVFGAVRRIP
jgi:hypothetical protein